MMDREETGPTPGRHKTGSMIRPFLMCSAMALAACQSAAVPQAPGKADLSVETLRRSPDARPPLSADGACWANDVTPAVFETITEQVEVAPATLGPDGNVLTPANYRSVAQQKIVRHRESIWFRTPCPAEMTVDFIATVQRALKARGLYMLPLSGVLDAPTNEAIRRFQEPLGLDSPVLSLAAARDLGIVAADFGPN